MKICNNGNCEMYSVYNDDHCRYYGDLKSCKYLNRNPEHVIVKEEEEDLHCHDISVWHEQKKEHKYIELPKRSGMLCISSIAPDIDTLTDNIKYLKNEIDKLKENNV